MLRKSEDFLQNFKNLTLGANPTTPKIVDEILLNGNMQAE